MRLRTVGRRSGQERIAILAYFTDGQNLVTMAMNGWGDPEPAWWLNLQAQPDVVVELPDGIHRVHGRVATPTERPQLWARWAEYNGANLEGWAARRSRRDGGRDPRATGRLTGTMRELAALLDRLYGSTRAAHR